MKVTKKMISLQVDKTSDAFRIFLQLEETFLFPEISAHFLTQVQASGVPRKVSQVSSRNHGVLAIRLIFK